MSMLEEMSVEALLKQLLFQTEALTGATSDKSFLLNQLTNPLLSEAEHHHNSAWAAHMSPSLAPYSALGQHIATLHGGNLLSPELYPVLKLAEQETLAWLCKKFNQQHAHFIHGSTYGNLEALWQARDSQASNHCKTVYGSTEVHYSVIKACQILGLQFIPIPSTPSGKINVPILAEFCRKVPPLAVVLNMGTTSSGVIDPISEVKLLLQQYETWIHIDAAWGGAVMLLPQYNLFHHLKEVDSISFDPHKALFQPKPSSVVFFKTARNTLQSPPSYLSSPPQDELKGSYGGELFLPLWLNLKCVGESWFVDQIQLRYQESCKFAEQLHNEFKCTVIQPETGIVCFKVSETPNIMPLVSQGRFSFTEVNGESYYRAVFASPDTTAENLFIALGDYL